MPDEQPSIERPRAARSSGVPCLRKSGHVDERVAELPRTCGVTAMVTLLARSARDVRQRIHRHRDARSEALHSSRSIPRRHLHLRDERDWSEWKCRTRKPFVDARAICALTTSTMLSSLIDKTSLSWARVGRQSRSRAASKKRIRSSGCRALESGARRNPPLDWVAYAWQMTRLMTQRLIACFPLFFAAVTACVAPLWSTASHSTGASRARRRPRRPRPRRDGRAKRLGRPNECRAHTYQREIGSSGRPRHGVRSRARDDRQLQGEERRADRRADLSM